MHYKTFTVKIKATCLVIAAKPKIENYDLQIINRLHLIKNFAVGSDWMKITQKLKTPLQEHVNGSRIKKEKGPGHDLTRTNKKKNWLRIRYVPSSAVPHTKELCMRTFEQGHSYTDYSHADARKTSFCKIFRKIFQISCCIIAFVLASV